MDDFYVDLTDGVLMQEIGKIKIAEKGASTPTKFDCFHITTLDRDAQRRFVRDVEAHKVVGETPKTLMVMLPYDEPQDNMPTYREFFTSTTAAEEEAHGAHRQCRGNGLDLEHPGTALWVNANGTKVSWPCKGKDCKWTNGTGWAQFKSEGKFVPRAKPLCKLHGVLQVMLCGIPNVGGVYTFKTTSYYSILNIQNCLKTLYAQTRGNLAMIPLEMKFQFANRNGNRIQLISLYYPGDLIQLFGAAKVSAELKASNLEQLNRLTDRRRKAIASGDFGNTTEEEDMTEAATCAVLTADIVTPVVPQDPETEEPRADDAAYTEDYSAEAVIREYLDDLNKAGCDIARALFLFGGQPNEQAIRDEILSFLADVQKEREAAKRAQDAEFADDEDLADLSGADMQLGPPVEMGDDFSLTPAPLKAADEAGYNAPPPPPKKGMTGADYFEAARKKKMTFKKTEDLPI